MAGDPLGGSEELWSRAALHLAAEGYRVSASVNDWMPLHKRAPEQETLATYVVEASLAQGCIEAPR